VLRLPFPLPADAPAGKNAARLVDQAHSIYRRLSEHAAKPLADRAGLIRAAVPELTDLVYEYFDIDSSERMLVEDTDNVLLRSTRRRRASERVPTLRATTPGDWDTYAGVVCRTLNDWTKGGAYEIRSTIHTSAIGGMGVVVFAKAKRGNHHAREAPNGEFLSAIIRVQRAFKKDLGSVEVLRGVKVFDGDKLYVLKPLNQRFWTRSAALNDADEIAGAVLSKTAGARA
jgi:hypothetical protein